MDESSVETTASNRQKLYRIGGMAALMAVLAALIKITITFLPGGSESLVVFFLLRRRQERQYDYKHARKLLDPPYNP
jgi:hypothetical protein